MGSNPDNEGTDTLYIAVNAPIGGTLVMMFTEISVTPPILPIYSTSNGYFICLICLKLLRIVTSKKHIHKN